MNVRRAILGNAHVDASIARSTEFTVEFQDLYDVQAASLIPVLEDGMAHREVRKVKAPALARIIYDMSRAVIAHRLLGWSDASIDEDTAILFDTIWKGVGCRKR